MTLSRVHAYIFFALILVPVLGTSPAGAQAANPCLAAYQQQIQSITKSRLELNDAYIKLQAQETIALNNCSQSQSTNQQQCVDQVVQQYAPLRKNLDDDGVLLSSAAAQASNNFNTGNCPWSAQEITQMISAFGQSVSQITQSIAQVITAAKGKGATGQTSSQKRTPPTTPPVPAQSP
jgi:hypothetical protein